MGMFDTSKLASGGLALVLSVAVSTPAFATSLDESQAAQDQGNKDSVIVIKTIRKFTKPKVNLRRAPAPGNVAPGGAQDTKLDPSFYDQQDVVLGTSEGESILDGISAWGSVTYNQDHEKPQGFTNRVSTWGFIGGGDTFLTDDVMAGVSLGYTRSNSNADAISVGNQFANTDIDADNLLVAPYATWFLNENIYTDAVIGLGVGDVKIDTADPGGANQDSRQDSRMVFASTSINFQEIVGDWDLFSSISYNFSKSYLSSATNNSNGAAIASTDKAVQFWGVDLEVGNSITDEWRVYGGVSTELYFKAQAVGFNDGAGTAVRVNDDSWGYVNVGTDYFVSDDITATFEATHSVAREKVSSWGGFVNLRMNF